jgi:signal transduction histidine kinase/ActR/RegA family two-component response regulator
LRPIRVYLLVLVLGALLPGALLTAFLVWRAFTNDRQVSERRLLDSARVDASALDREFAGTISMLQALGTSPALDHEDFEAFYVEARRAQATQPGWDTIELLAPDGQALVSTNLPWGTPLAAVPEPDSLRELTDTRAPVVGTIRSGPEAGTEHLFAIRVPVFREERFSYVLSAIVNVESLARVVPRQLSDTEEWTRAILDPQGTIAVRTRGADEYVGARANDAFLTRIRKTPELVSAETTRDGVPVYAATSRGAFGWMSIVVVKRAALDAPLLGSMAGVMAGGVVLMLCGLAAVLLVSRRLASDLSAATLAAEAVADGRTVSQGKGYVAETLQLHRSLAATAALLEVRAGERDEEVRRADAARAEAEEANRTKDQFMAVLGHELRNPLAPALTALELMKSRDPQVFRREREVLERQVAHMSRLVNDLLEVSRLSRGMIQLDCRRVEVREAVDRAVDMARPLIAQHRHTLEVDVPAVGLIINADVDRIVQVLSNLLTNAAKYTPPGGHVTISARAMSGQAVIACEDDGPGVPPELASTLFVAFTQGPRTFDRREGGLGLGLSLARSLTELHNGTIRVEGRGVSRGSRFVVSLPLAAPADGAADAGSSRTAPPTTAERILVVDDNVDACDMLRFSLEDEGYAVAVAHTGSEALVTDAGFRADVALLDIGLPGMNGYELAGRLRAVNPTIRLIALTGYGQATDREAAIAAGFDAHCTKPVTMSELHARIDATRERAVRVSPL